MPAKLRRIIIASGFLIFFSIASVLVVNAATDCKTEEECAKKIEEKNKEYASTSKKLNDLVTKLNSVNKTITDLSGKLNVTQAQLQDVEDDINSAQKELDEINKNLSERREKLQDKIDLRNSVLRSYAKDSNINDLELFLTQNGSMGLNGFQLSTFNYIFNKSVTEETLRIIGILNSEINSFEQDKQEALAIKDQLEKSRDNLVALKKQIEQQKNSAQNQQKDIEDDKEDTEEKLEDIQEAIQKLSAKQQQIIAEKSGAGTSSVGDYEQPEASLPNPPFSPAFVAMSYGAYTHYNGMSQYGAKGRAEDGKSYKEILKFYYKVDTKKLDDFPSKIKVSGHGEMDFQKYLYGIAEMPSDWPDEALKAQAIAARSYAYKASKPICTSESCQVFLKSKSDNPPAKWKKAVDDTKNIILNNSSTSQYSSTTGGYINNVGWDLKGSKWPGDAYEKKAGSPWFYKAWYTKSYSPSSDKCGRSTPYLSAKEMADILNAVEVFKKGNGDDRDRISPTTTNCWGGDPYSMDEMAERADEVGTSYSSVSGVSVDIGNNGQTNSVTFQTNNGSVTINGQDFKSVFNLRAPGYISIRSRLFDMVKK